MRVFVTFAVIAVAAGVGYVTAASRFTGTRLCPGWLARFFLGERRR